MRQFEQDRKAALAGKYNYLNPKKSATVPSEYIKQVLMRGTGFIGGKGRVCKILKQRLMQEPGQSVSKQNMVREVQAGRLTDWDCTDMTHFMGTDCVFSGEMRMERLKDMFRGKISKRAWCPYSYRGIPA